MTLRSCARTFFAGPTMSIIEGSLVLWRLVARAKQSAPSGGNGRRVISVDRPLRLRTAPRERPGCSPASLPPEGTSWPFSRCIGPDGPPVGGVQQLRLPWFSRKMYVYLRVSGVSRAAGGKAPVLFQEHEIGRVSLHALLTGRCNSAATRQPGNSFVRSWAPFFGRCEDRPLLGSRRRATMAIPDAWLLGRRDKMSCV